MGGLLYYVTEGIIVLLGCYCIIVTEGIIALLFYGWAGYCIIVLLIGQFGSRRDPVFYRSRRPPAAPAEAASG